MSEVKRENWGSKLGLILAMAGNAIGLGNFWRYPYQAASNGGGAFMIPYFFALVFMGIPLMFVEWNLGKTGGKYGHGTLGPMVYLQAREKAKPRNAAVLGAIAGGFAFAVTVLVNSYYNHIIGWTLGYSVMSFTGGYMDPAVKTVDILSKYLANPANLGFWVVTLALLALAVNGGIKKGIEVVAKIMMPLIYVFGIVLIVKTLTLGSPVKPDWSPLAGLDFIWSPRWQDLNFKSAMAAAGQIFFTLSLGMGIIANYASYLKADDDIVLSGFTTVALNEFAEVILGGTIAIPIAFTFLGTEGLGAGVGLSFISLPNIFRIMGGGGLFGGLWFLLLFFAGFTSAIAMFNYLTALLEEEMGIQRKFGTWAIFGLYVLVGLPIALEATIGGKGLGGLNYFSAVDNWVGNVFLIVLGLIEVVVTGWLMGRKGLDEINHGSYWKLPKWFYVAFIQILTPVSILAFLVGFLWTTFTSGTYKVVDTWSLAGTIVSFAVVVIGAVQAYVNIKRKYGEELSSNTVKILK
ncbi:MAG: sodium-dependent transporter [Spirochaetaceae bacterium]|nr:sodium-dependent transporter [Spirochaetaceae bacterium]